MNKRVNKFQVQPASGFTLIEIMVVVLILGIMASVVVPKIMKNPGKARATMAKTHIQSIESSMDMYRMDNFKYPTTSEGIAALVTKPAEATPNWSSYLKNEPKDPWGKPYKYVNPGTHGEIDIYSLGADGIPSDDDIGNWVKK